MSVTVRETRRSRQAVSGNSPTARREYVAYGSEDPAAIELAVIAVAPLAVDGLVRQTVTVAPRDESASVFDVEIEYGKREKQEQPETGAEEISFEISPQTTRITQSKRTRSYQPPFAPDYKGGIGFKQGGGFEGVDVYVESLAFSITRYVPAAAITNSFVAELRDAAFKVNNASWRGFAEGEVLFMGAAGSRRDAESYGITYRFQVSANGTVDIGSGIPPVFKYGWDYVWTKYDKIEDTRTGEVVERPVGLYVEKVYDSVNFPAKLGLDA